MPTQHYNCTFSHLILSGRCSCQHSSRDCFAEKEFGACLNYEASNNCESIYLKLKENSNFALNAHNQTNLSVGQQAKIKMGGLLALQAIVIDVDEKSIKDISILVQKIKEKYSSFSNLPFSKLMPKIAKFKFREKS